MQKWPNWFNIIKKQCPYNVFELLVRMACCFPNYRNYRIGCRCRRVNECRNDETGSILSKSNAHTMYFELLVTMACCFQNYRNYRIGSKSSRTIARTMCFELWSCFKGTLIDWFYVIFGAILRQAQQYVKWVWHVVSARLWEDYSSKTRPFLGDCASIVSTSASASDVSVMVLQRSIWRG